MSFLDSLFGGLFGGDNEQEETVEHPCSNCPSSCLICPDACSVCQPYKEQMIDAIYRVEHKDEIISQYEVVGTAAAQGGTVVCPHCGGHTENPYVCDYCGSRLQDGTGKIQVASAADIPNPILEAQDIIFARQNAVRQYSESLSDSNSGGFLSSLFDSLLGSGTTEESISIGKKMTESEIKEMADYFKVSVSEYLTGLDNGKYPTLSNKETYAQAEKEYSESSSGSSGDMLSGLAGLAGAFGLGSAILGGTSSTHQNNNYNSSLFGSMSSLFHTGTTGSQMTGGYMQNTQKPYSQNTQQPYSQNTRPPMPQHQMAGQQMNQQFSFPQGMNGQQGKPSHQPPHRPPMSSSAASNESHHSGKKNEDYKEHPSQHNGKTENRPSQTLHAKRPESNQNNAAKKAASAAGKAASLKRPNGGH